MKKSELRALIQEVVDKSLTEHKFVSRNDLKKAVTKELIDNDLIADRAPEDKQEDLLRSLENKWRTENGYEPEDEPRAEKLSQDEVVEKLQREYEEQNDD